MTRAESASSPGVYLVNESNESRRRWPPPWLIALAAIGLYWLALGRRHAEHVSGNPIEVLPFVLAGLSVVAAIGLLAGGPLGRVVSALIAVAGAARALFTVVLVAGMIITDPQSTTSLNAWGFLAIFLGIAAGYGLVLVRAIRGRQPHPGSRPRSCDPAPSSQRTGPNGGSPAFPARSHGFRDQDRLTLPGAPLHPWKGTRTGRPRAVRLSPDPHSPPMVTGSGSQRHATDSPASAPSARCRARL